MRQSAVRCFSRLLPRLQDARPRRVVRRQPSPESLAAVREMLAKPTWSITSLLPPSHPRSTSTAPPDADDDVKITPEKLEHLLRLSGLPMPKDKAEEDRLIQDLTNQLHFVGKVREVDVTGIEPLVAIRDESVERPVTLEDVEKAAKATEWMGPMGKQEWDPLREAKDKLGRYFVVEGQMGEGSAAEEVVVSAEEVKKVAGGDTVEARENNSTA
ncbi:hypothetical protein Dda_4422 [Drechslerella dactyloides]|uniref:Glutamyl-tRNA amidotransferase complex subunit Gta3 domain-containing protein n=1 Tax=Drechslerella dactyloides TaxID=74499 RepID=A0AAD6NKK5_DREDA|nr:hypothetical protein Dda_4422 [Drechslerella dactyloides]